MSPTVGEIERLISEEESRKKARWRAGAALALPLALLGIAGASLSRGHPWGLAVLALFLVHEFLVLGRAEAVDIPRERLPWILALLTGIWAAVWAWGPPHSSSEARALTEALRFCRPEAPGHPFSFLLLALPSALPEGWAPWGLALIQAALAGTALSLVLALARILDVRPGLALGLTPLLAFVSILRPGTLWSAEADLVPALVTGLLILALFRVTSSPGAGSGLAGFFWCLLLFEQPWAAVLTLPGILVYSLGRPRLGSWRIAFRGLPGALAVFLALPWAGGLAKTTPGWGYSLDGYVAQFFHPWLEGWQASMDPWGAFRSASASSHGLILVLAVLSPLLGMGWRSLSHGILYSQFFFAWFLAAIIPDLEPACRPFWILAYPLALVGIDGAWDRMRTWPLRPRVGARMALAAALGAGLMIQVHTSLRGRADSDGPVLLETARRIWLEAGVSGIILCDDEILKGPLEYIEAFEPASVPRGAELLFYKKLGLKAYVQAVIEKRPAVLFSEFLDGNPAAVAQGLAAAMPGRRLALVGDGPRKAFSAYHPVPRILCDLVDAGPRKISPPDPAAALEDLPLQQGGPLAQFVAEGFVRLGLHALKNGKSGQAFTSASRALDFFPESTDARKLRQEVYEGSGRLEQARAGYEEILRRTPADIQARLDLARVLMKKNANDEATLHFQEVLRLNRRAAEAHLGLGRIQAAKGENATALASLEKGLALQPEDDEARLILARLYLSLENPRAAEEHLRFLLEKQPDNAKIQELLGKALASKDRP